MKPDENRQAAEQTNVSDIHEPLLHVQDEPMEGSEPVPLWLIMFVTVVLLAGGMYLGMFSGGFSGSVYDENAGLSAAGSGAGEKEEAGSGDPVADLVKLGKRQFINNCAACHQPTGLGIAGQFPPLAGSEYANGPERRVISIVLHGIEGPITVHGQTFNGAMPPWGGNLDDKKIAAILTYVRQEWGNKAPPISPEQVAAIRKETESRGKVWSEAELKALPDTPVPGGFDEMLKAKETGGAPPVTDKGEGA